MPKTRNVNRNKKATRKYVRKMRRSTRKMNGGAGCNCGKIFGGNINPASFDGGLDGKYYYAQNSESMNPNTPSFQISGRNLPTISGGAKKRRMKKMKMKGGGWFSMLGDAYSQNPLVNFGTLDGASSNSSTFFANMPTNPSIIEQPAMRGYSKDLPPLA